MLSNVVLMPGKVIFQMFSETFCLCELSWICFISHGFVLYQLNVQINLFAVTMFTEKVQYNIYLYPQHQYSAFYGHVQAFAALH